MPRSKPSKVEELRVTLGTKERQLAEDFLASYRIQAITGEDSVIESLSDGTKLLSALATLGELLELVGITDIFDFDEKLEAEYRQAKEKIEKKVKEKGWDFATDIGNPLTSIFFPWSIPFRAADYVRDKI
jgi:hypothetical protein